MLRLKRNTGFVPQGCAFTDPRTGKEFCGYQWGIEGAVKKIIEHRLRNPNLYPPNEPQWFTESQVQQELLLPTFAKYPHLFRDETSVMIRGVKVDLTTSKCECGADNSEPIYCPTCSGKRIIGWRCTVCQKPRIK